MKKIFWLVILLTAIMFGQTYNPYTFTGWDAPYAYTGDSLASPSWSSGYGYYGIGIMTIGSNPGGWLNYNYWKIDSLLQALVVYTDTSQIIVQNDTLMLAPMIAAAIDTQYTPFWLDFTLIDADSVPHQEGRLFYDNVSHSLSVYVDEADVTHNLGREAWIRAYNNSGGLIDDGKAVYLSGVYTGGTINIPEISLAKADADATSQVMGIATHSIEDGTYGYVTRIGCVGDVNTVGLVAGAPFYLSAATAGDLTATAPTAPDNVVVLGRALDIGASGDIFAAVFPFNPINGIAAIGFIDSAEVITVTVQSDLYRITSATNSLFEYNSDVGHDITLSGDTIYVAEPGVYNFVIGHSFEGVNLAIYKFQMKLNNAIVPNAAAYRKTSGTDVGNSGYSASIKMDAGDAVTFWVSNTANTGDLTMIGSTIVVEQVR